jgi:sulfite dehydrogenase
MTEATQFLRRRQLLAGSAGALAVAGLAGFAGEAAAQAASAPAAPRPLPPYAAWKDANAVIVHSAQTIETRRAAFGTSVVTPSEQLYVPNNLPPPDASWWPIAMAGRWPSRACARRAASASPN